MNKGDQYLGRVPGKKLQLNGHLNEVVLVKLLIIIELSSAIWERKLELPGGSVFPPGSFKRPFGSLKIGGGLCR